MQAANIYKIPYCLYGIRAVKQATHVALLLIFFFPLHCNLLSNTLLSISAATISALPCCPSLHYVAAKYQMASSSSTETNTTTETNPSMPTIPQNPTTPIIPHTPTTPNIPQIQQPIPVTHLSSFAQSITKLNKENYLTWRGLVEPFLKGHDLHGFIDGTNTPPSPQVSTSPNGTLTVSTNPDTVWWLRQDQLILSMLMSSISDDMLPQVISCKTAQELWTTLDQIFTSESQARTLNLRLQLTTAKKGNLSISDFFCKIKQIIANLAAAGHPVSDSEFTASLLGGLGPEYDPFVTSVTTRVEPLSMNNLFGHLLAHEARIAQHHQMDSLFPTANIATRSSNSHRGRSRTFPRSSSQAFRSRGRAHQLHAARSQSGPTGHHSNIRPNNSMGSPRFSPHVGSRPICQVCGKMGHSALNCYHRFDQAYQAAGPNLTAYTATSSYSRDLNWYPDTGATNHVTSDLNNLSLHSEAYDGPDELQVGNGTRLAIKNIGISKLSSLFTLRHVLHVPKITKNLISVQKFTADNNVSMEFHPSCFLLRIACPGKYCIRARVEMAYIIGSLPQQHHHVSSSMNVLLQQTGTLALDILPIA
jgi:hypothetical protein